MIPFNRPTLAVLILACIELNTPAADDRWPQFRGPGGAGVAAANHPGPTDFGPGKKEVWRIDLPFGLSSPCIWGDRIFLTACEPNSKKLETLCIQRSDGRILWRQPVEPATLEKVHETSSPANATCACDGDRVFSYFGSYGLIAYTIDGQRAWELPLPTPDIMFGSGTSPVICGDLVVLNRMFSPFGAMFSKSGGTSAKSEILAVDRRTGKIAWSNGLAMTPRGRSHMTPAVCNDSGRNSIIVAGDGTITALDAGTGKKIWWVRNLPIVATASPLISGDRLFLNCTGLTGDTDRVEPPSFEQALEKWDTNKDGKLQLAEIPEELAVLTRHREDKVGDFSLKMWFFRVADADGDGALSAAEWKSVFTDIAGKWQAAMKPALASIKLGGEGDVTATHLAWSTSRGVPEVPCAVAVKGRIYTVRNGGLVTCFDRESGKVLFDERLGASGTYYASPITDGVNIYFVSCAGVINILRAADTFHRTARIDMKDDVAATPAIVDGRLYVRTAKHLYAFGHPPSSNSR